MDSSPDSLSLARALLLAPSGLDDSRIDRALGTLLGAAIDDGDIYFQLSRDESWSLEDGVVKEGSASIEQGVGVRALAGEKTGFAYSVPRARSLRAAATAVPRHWRRAPDIDSTCRRIRSGRCPTTTRSRG
jgi:TldD protein